MVKSLEIPTTLYIAVGRIVVNWAYVEMALDQCITLIYRRCKGKQIEKEIPVMLKRKVRVLSKAFRNLPPLASFREEALELLKRVSDLTENRHEPVHGAFFGIDPESGAFLFTRIDHTQANRPAIDAKRDFMEIHQAGGDMLMLAHDFAQFAARLVDHFSRS